jgi:hypothetical protein
MIAWLYDRESSAIRFSPSFATMSRKRLTDAYSASRSSMVML